MPVRTVLPLLSIVVPVHDEAENVEPLHDELQAMARGLERPYEIVFVDDGSRDATLPTLEALAARHPETRVVVLDGNFGEAAALSAGFAHARGEVVATLDGDGQNPPAEIPRLLVKLDEGYDVVSGRRITRQEDSLRRVWPSRLANRLIVLATGVPVHDCGCGLKAYRREVLAGAALPRGMNRFLPAILGVRPERVAEVPVADRARTAGRSHYGLWRVAVVLRDLPSLPLLVRRPPPGRSHVRAAAIATGALGAATLTATLLGHAVVALVLAAGTATSYAIHHNLRRFVQARESGVYRIRRGAHGTIGTEDRDRGSRLLGQEPAAHVQPSARRPGHAPV